MDVVLHPGFRENRLVYFSYSDAGAGGKGVVLARGVLADGAQPALPQVETLFRASPYVTGDGHFAGRIAFSADGSLFFAAGERQKFDPAQDPKATLGKVLRLTDAGAPAPGNPLADRGFHPAIWSYGHRNPLGLAFDASGNLWAQEMGPRGGDEVNLILPGRNYGYPIVSDGDHYDGRPIPDHATRPEFEAPKVAAPARPVATNESPRQFVTARHQVSPAFGRGRTSILSDPNSRETVRETLLAPAGTVNSRNRHSQDPPTPRTGPLIAGLRPRPRAEGRQDWFERMARTENEPRHRDDAAPRRSRTRVATADDADGWRRPPGRCLAGASRSARERLTAAAGRSS